MKILQIHPSLASGGIESMITGISNELVMNNNVSFCSIFKINTEDYNIQLLNNEINIYSLNKVKKGFSLKVIFQILLFIQKGHYQIVHIHGFFHYYFLSILFLHHKCHFIYTVHSDAFMENTPWEKRLFPIKKLFFKCNWIHPVTISANSQKSFTNLYHIESSLIKNGVAKPVLTDNYSDTLFHKRSLDTIILFHAGRITKAKNQCVLCQAVQELINEGLDIRLFIAGVKEDLDIYQSLLPFFSDKIQYLGERSDIRDLMSKADCLCLPSRWEGLPCVVLEALSVGCVPICAPVGGIPEVIEDGKNGILAEDSSLSATKIAIRRYIKLTFDKRMSMREAAIQSFCQYDIAQTAHNYENLYKDLLYIS